MADISKVSEHGYHHVSFDVEGENDLNASYVTQRFCPSHVGITYLWSDDKPWGLMWVEVSGLRRLASGKLGVERKKACFSGYDKDRMPEWLAQLVRRFRPTDRDPQGD
jgi:hypothetical protein